MRTITIKLSSQAALGNTTPTATQHLVLLPQALSCALTVMVLAGIWALVLKPLAHRIMPEVIWTVFAAAILALFLFRLAIPSAFEPRHLTNVQPALVAFIAGGVVWFRDAFASRLGHRRTWVAIIVAAAGSAFLLESFRFPPRRYYGFEEAASELAGRANLGGQVFLVCSDSHGEGAFVAHMAALDQRPGLIVLRGNKMLADVTWGGTRYSLRFTTPAEVMKFMESVPVRVLVLESPSTRTPSAHEILVEQMIRQYPERWSLIGSYPELRPASPPGASVRAYRLLGREGQSRSRIRVDLRRRLGRVIEN
jgi:hypothetical protein